MKSTIAAVAAAATLFFTGANVLAQPAPGAPATSPAAPAAEATAAAPAAMRVSLDSPIEAIAADPGGKVVLDAAVPGITSHPAYAQFKSMSLKQLQPFSQGQITDDVLAKVGTGLAALK